MDKDSVRFVRTEEGMKLMGFFIAGLVMNGIVFTTEEHGGYYEVRMTGGF